MTPIEKMNRASHNFTKTDFVIYNYILADPIRVVHSNIYDLAKWTGVSRSAILRFAQKIGYNGFSEFKYDFSRYVHGGSFHTPAENREKTEEIADIYQKTIGLMGEFLHDSDVNLLAEKLILANRVKIFGLNRTGHSAQQLRQRFHKINFDAEAVTDYVLIPEIASQGRPDDLHLYFSTQGETPIIFEAIKASCQQKVYTVLITMNGNTKMKKYTDLLIQLPTTKAFSSDYFFDIQPINMIFIEILISCLGEKLTSK